MIRSSARLAAVSSILKSGAAAIAILAPAAALAQDAPSAEDDIASGNAILVTATKREQTLQEVPVAVTVTTAEVLERENIRDLRDLQTVVPSLRVSQLQSSANSNFIIRGFGNGANNAGIEPSVGVFVDGVYRSRTASQIGDLPDVARIEVLRGPQSTLFGKNASAGVISIVTREPSFDFEGAAEISYGNYDAVVSKGYISGPITDSFAVSFAGGFNTRDGYNRDLGSGDDSNGRDRWFVRGQALFDNGNNLKFRLIGDYDKIDEICCGVVNLQSSAATQAVRLIGGQVSDPANPFGNVIYSNFASTNLIENQGVSGQIDFEAGDITLTSITAYRETDAAFDQDVDFTSADVLQRFQTQELETFTQEIRATGSWGPLTALVGVFYFDESVREDQRVGTGPGFRNYANISIQQATMGTQNVTTFEQTLGALYGNPAQFVNRFFTAGTVENGFFTLENEAISVFGQVDFEITDRLVLTLGGNYTKDEKASVTNYQTTDVFSNIDLVDAGARAITAQAIATQVGGALMLGRAATQAEITAFATGTSPAGAAGAMAFPTIQAGAAAFGAANASGSLNPFLNLRPLQLFPRFVNIPNSVESGATNDDNFSYTIRLAYDVNNDINIYASYATGFKASSFNLSRDGRPRASDIAAIRAAGLGFNNLTSGSRFAGPEEANVFELGLKGDWGDFSVNADVFRQDIDGFQSNTFTGTGFFLANAGKQRTWGVEFEGAANPVEQLTLNLGVTWLDSNYESYVASPVGDISGTKAAGIPEWTVSVGGRWEEELANGDIFAVGGTYRFESETSPIEGLPGFVQRDTAGNIIQSSVPAAIAAAAQFSRQVDEVSASISYTLTDNGLEFSLWGRNLLNDRYIVQIFDAPGQPFAINGYPNQPRTYGGSIRYRF